MFYRGRCQQGFKFVLAMLKSLSPPAILACRDEKGKISGVLVFLFASLQRRLAICQVGNELAAVASLKSWLSRKRKVCGQVCYMQAKLE